MLDGVASTNSSNLPVESIFPEIGLPTGFDRRRRLVEGDPVASLNLPELCLVLLFVERCIWGDSVVGVATFTRDVAPIGDNIFC